MGWWRSRTSFRIRPSGVARLSASRLTSMPWALRAHAALGAVGIEHGHHQQREVVQQRARLRIGEQVVGDVEQRGGRRRLVAVHLRPEQHAPLPRAHGEQMDGAPLDRAADLLEPGAAGVLRGQGPEARDQVGMPQARRRGVDDPDAGPGLPQRLRRRRWRGDGGGGEGEGGEDHGRASWDDRRRRVKRSGRERGDESGGRAAALQRAAHLGRKITGRRPSAVGDEADLQPARRRPQQARPRREAPHVRAGHGDAHERRSRGCTRRWRARPPRAAWPTAGPRAGHPPAGRPRAAPAPAPGGRPRPRPGGGRTRGSARCARDAGGGRG